MKSFQRDEGEKKPKLRSLDDLMEKVVKEED